LVAVGSASNSAAANKVTSLFCTQRVCYIASTSGV
jgi:hypothetical protein